MRLLTLEKAGFNQKVHINSCVEYGEEKYIIRAIGEIGVRLDRIAGVKMFIKVAVQKKGTVNLLSLKEKEEIVTCKLNVAQMSASRSNVFPTVGSLFMEDGIAYQILRINNVRYEFVDIIMTIETRTISELPTSELSKFLREESLNKKGWKIISNGGES